MLTNCPVSSGLSVRYGGSLNYPLDFFSRNQLLEIILKQPNFSSIDLDRSTTFYNCSAEIKDHCYNCKSPLICPDRLLSCPLKQDYVDIGLSQDLYTHDFCDIGSAFYGFSAQHDIKSSRDSIDNSSNHKNNDNNNNKWTSFYKFRSYYLGSSPSMQLQKAIPPMQAVPIQNQREIIRVLIFGGSVTAGHYTRGSYCDSTTDTRCPNPDNKSGEVPLETNWSYYLEKWMREKSKAKIVFHRFYHGGTTSGWAQELILPLLKQHGITKLNSNDLVFIDYSVNDQLTKSNPINVEELVRKLLLRSESTKSLRDKPNIVLLAQYAQDRNSDDSYINYLKTAEKFNVSFWSPHDLMFSKYMNDPEAKVMFDHVAAWDGRNYHIPWFGHLFLADLYASMFEFVTSSCRDNTTRYNKKDDQNWFVPLPDYSTPPGCSIENFIYISSAEEIKRLPNFQTDIVISKKQLVTTSGARVAVEPIGSWKLTTEKNGKVGFVTIPNPQVTHVESSIPLDSTRSIQTFDHDTLNFGGNLTFWIPSSKLPLQTYETINLRIEYLRTYENAGKVDVYVCGKIVACLDALWKSNDYKYSLSHMKVFSLQLRSICSSYIQQSEQQLNSTTNIPANSLLDVVGATEYPVTFVSPSSNEATDERPYRHRRLQKDNFNQGDNSKATLRGNEKFKLIGLSFCV